MVYVLVQSEEFTFDVNGVYESLEIAKSDVEAFIQTLQIELRKNKEETATIEEVELSEEDMAESNLVYMVRIDEMELKIYQRDIKTVASNMPSLED